MRHGESRPPTAEWKAWSSMRDRCNCSTNKSYKNYGGRGIRICKRWDKFENFLADMGRRPSSLHSLDRYPDNNGDYKPSNCRWATKKEQASNRRAHPSSYIHPSTAKIYCPNGHLYNKENTYFYLVKRGKWKGHILRHCRTCHREKERIRRNSR